MREPVRILVGDVLEGLAAIEAGSVHCCVTSPPYWGLRDYGVDGQIGLEPTPEAFVEKMVEVFRAVKRVLREDGTLWLNLGDCYLSNVGGKSSGAETKGGVAGHVPNAWGGRTQTPGLSRPPYLKPKDLMMMPWRVALALQADGWWLRSVICWAKKSPMPESVMDRPTASWEPIFLLAKSERYFYDAEAVKEPLNWPEDRRPPVGTMDGQQRPASGGRMPPIGGVKHAGNNGNATYSGDRPEWPSGRNQRNVWHLGPEPYPEAHFATFPTEIPRRAIKAGTSEKGCCGACGAPHVRRMARTDHEDPSAKGSTFDGGKTGTRDGGERTQKGPRMLKAAAGWDASCACEAEVVPCTVLDPFLGSGTTLAVARELGRHGVGCELNPEYVKLARDRIGKAEKPTTYRSDKVEESPLFAGLKEVRV